MNDSAFSRRAFVGAAIASPLARAASANDRIRLGIVGTGGRGFNHINDLAKMPELNVAVTAVCDVYRPNRERAIAALAKTYGAAPRQTTDYQELLGWTDVDAVILSAPDFTHSVMLKHAVEAGKDVYCEKPFAVDFAEGKAAWLAVKNSSRVVQIGTQRRSEGPLMGCAKIVQTGVLGQVTRVEFSVNFQEARWRRDYSKVQAADIDWRRFLMHRPERPFDARVWREWQLFRLCTNGIAGLWMCHFIDLVPWFLGDPYPTSVTANGGVYLWNDGRETEDVFHALLNYPGGTLVSFAMSLTNASGDRNMWYGTKGTLDANAMTITGAGSKRPDRIAEEIRIQPEPTTHHMRNFIECVRSRKKPRADIEAGFAQGVAVCMAGQAFDTGRRVRFDRDRMEVIQS